MKQVWEAFEKSFEQSTSFWHFRDAYLADFRQDESETTADLDLRIKQTVRGCQWKKETEEERMIDLLYHATIYYEIRKFVQESEPAALTYEMVIEKAKAHERNVLEYKDHQASHRGANSAPSYNNPLLSAHALSKRRPSGRGNNGQRCGKCGKSHERGNCPAYGKTCDKCQGINHFKAVCRSKVTAKMAQSPHRSKKSQLQRHGSTGSYNGQGKGGGNRQHQKKKTPKKPPKQRAYAVTFKNSVPSGVTTTSGGKREKHGNVSSKMVLSGPEEEGTYNRFSCFAVHSKMSHSTNAKSKPGEGLYTDTDPDDRSEIITDVTIIMPGKAGTMMMEVKVDPGVQPSCIPLHKFKTLFPHLCRDGLPKEGLLDNTQNEFQSYNGGDMTCYGHILIDVKDKVTKKYHPIRFYVMNTDVPRILISHAASYWLGLVRVLCDNKAPRIKRQVASIDKKSDFRAKSGHFRTSSPNMASSSQKKQTTPKTVTSGKAHVPGPRMHSFEDAKIQGRKTATGVRSGRDVDISDGEQHSQEESSATTGKEPKTSKSGNSVHSGPNKNITDSVKDGPFSNQTASNSNTKSGPKMKHTSKKAPRRKYYRPSNDTKTFQINNKGHLQCLQDPNLIHKPDDKGKLPGSREAPTYHEPGTVSCKTVEDLKKLYPNSFDRLGSLKGAYNIRVDPTVKPVTHARRKVPIKSKEAIDKELDYLIEEEIITEQVEPTPWVSSVTFPRKPNGEVRVCLDPSNLNKAIIREHHKPMTVEEIAHELAGATVYTKADALKAFLQIHLTHEASLLMTFNSHRGWLRFLWMPFEAKMSQDVFQLRMDAILEQCPGVIGIHNDMVIFGVDQEDHDANLINLLNVCQKEELVLNSKKLELQRERVTFFGAEYSTQGMHPDPKKVQGITEMTAPTEKQQLQSFLGMVNYMGTFIPNLSHHTEPLRAMLKKDNVFHWDDQQTRSFQQVKTLITKANTTPLRYYDRNLLVTVQADASLRRLGACLIQQHKGKDQPIAFASKSLTDAETRYANIERELLAIVFACQRFSNYLLRRSFVAESDHKPLEMIAMKNLVNAPPRLQRMLLELQKYDVTIKYRPGKEMQLADTLSHCLARASQEIKLEMRVDYIAFTKPWIEKLKDSTQRDPILATVYQLTQQGWLHQRRHVPRLARRYWDFRDELSTDDGMLLKGPRLIIPGELQEEYLSRLHKGHLSASKVQENAKQHMYWTGIDADIEDYTKQCQECIKRSQVAKEPLQPHDIPEGPWRKLGIDYFTFDGNSYVLICDYFSKFPFLYRAKTSFWSLRDCLINLFSIEGYPDEIVSDNGPPFQSKEFAKFLSGLGIKHTTSSPGYPRSNGFIERHIQTVKNMLSKSSNTQSFQEVLADLRTTRIGTGLPSPAEILHGRNLTTRVQGEIDIKAIHSVLQERQLKMTLDHDSSRRAKKARPLVVGERCHVLGPGNKWIDAFVTGITDSGRSYETQVEVTGKQFTRNRSHIRPRSPDIPHMHASFLQHNAVPSATSDGNAPSERQNSVISGRQQLANGQKTVLSGNRKGSIKQTNTSQVLVSETVPDRRVQLSRRAKMTRFGDNPVTSTVPIPPRRQPGCDTSTRNRREFKLNVTDPDLLIPIKQTRVTSRHSDLREPQPSSSDSQPASSQPVSETTTSESSVSLPSSPSGSSSTESTSTSGTNSSSCETSSESSSQPSLNASSPETSSSASTSRSTSPELLEMERSFNSLLAGTRDHQGHPMMRSQMDNLRDQQQRIAVLKQVASQPQNQPRPVSAPSVANMPLPPYPRRRPSDKGSTKQVQAENANALHKSSDSETDRLQDIQEEPRRRIGPSRVKELAKFFTPTSDEEENSRVNSRTRCKKLFEPKKEEESEK